MGMNLHNSPQPEPTAGPGLRQTSWIYRIFQYGFALWAGLLFCVCLRWHNNPFLSLGRVKLAITSLLCAGVLYVLFRFWERVIPVPRHPRRAALVLLAVYGMLLVAFGLLMQVKFGPSWDFPVVASEAAAFVLEGTPPGTYFVLGISNAPLYWVHVGCFRLLYALGVRDLMPGLVLLNCACILISLYLFYRAAALIWDEKRALFVLCCAFLYPGLFLYAPIAYTDTLSLPFVSGAVLLWLRARCMLIEGDAPRALRFAVAACFVTALGAVLKVSVAVLAVAFVIDLVLLWKGRIRWYALAASAVCFLVVLFGGIRLSHTGFPEYDQEPFPLTHWIMMGLHENGGYWDPDFQLTLQYDTYEERAAFTREEIVRRIEAMGLEGFIRHCVNKLSYIYSDGACYAPCKLDIGARYPNPLHDWTIQGGKYTGYLHYAADSLQLCLLALCAWGGLCAARRNQAQTAFLRVAWFGLALFLLIWEARSRYVVNFLPIFLLCAAGGLPEPGETWSVLKNRKTKIKEDGGSAE